MREKINEREKIRDYFIADVEIKKKAKLYCYEKNLLDETEPRGVSLTELVIKLNKVVSGEEYKYYERYCEPRVNDVLLLIPNSNEITYSVHLRDVIEKLQERELVDLILSRMNSIINFLNNIKEESRKMNEEKKKELKEKKEKIDRVTSAVEFNIESFIAEVVRSVCKIFNDYDAIILNEKKYCKKCKKSYVSTTEFYDYHKERCKIYDIDDVFMIAFFDCLK